MIITQGSFNIAENGKEPGDIQTRIKTKNKESVSTQKGEKRNKKITEILQIIWIPTDTKLKPGKWGIIFYVPEKFF